MKGHESKWTVHKDEVTGLKLDGQITKIGLSIIELDELVCVTEMTLNHKVTGLIDDNWIVL